MPALMKTNFGAKVVWIGHVADRASGMRSVEVPTLDLDFAGPVGESHGGLTRPSDSRVTEQYRRGTTIRNTRQLSLVAAEDLALIAAACGVALVDPRWLGATMVVEGLADFSHIPPSARLQAPSGATIVVDMENRPCQFPAKEIEAEHPGAGRLFKRAATGRRWVTAWVERPGKIALGDHLTLHIPDQPVWTYLQFARDGGVSGASDAP